MGNYLFREKPVTKCKSCSKYKDMVRLCKQDVKLLTNFNDDEFVPKSLNDELMPKYIKEFNVSPNITPDLWNERSRSVSPSRNGGTRKYRRNGSTKSVSPSRNGDTRRYRRNGST